jgi:hypothetical protein
MVAEIEPEVVAESVPILTGLLKFPNESDNWAVNTLPWVQEVVMVKGIVNAEPAQNEEFDIKPTVNPSGTYSQKSDL